MTKYMRKLITKDGIESPLEEIKVQPYPRQNVLRVCKPRATYDTCEELSPLPMSITEPREYRMSREEHMIIWIYEEV